MTTPHRTLQMALDALDAITDDVDGTGLNTMPSFDKAIDAIAALSAALAQPEPEPVAWKCARCGNTSDCQGVTPDDNWCNSCAACGDMKPLFATTPAAPIDGFGGNLDEAFDWGTPHDVSGAPWPDAPAPAVPSDAALNTLAKLFHNGEEIEGDDGAAIMVDMALWHEASEAFDSLIGDGDGETLASSAAPAVPDDIAAIIACLGDDAALLRETTDDSEEIAQNMDDAAAALERLSAAPAVREPQDERAAFEAWIRKDSGDLTTFGSGSNMHYRNSAVNNAWTGWQARAHGIGGGGK